MRKNGPRAVATLTMSLLMAAGCAETRDDEFRQLAHEAIREQAQQNARLAEQGRLIAEASQRLVEGDADARQELLKAQQQLTSELHTERAGLNRQREELDQERRAIAAQRHRDPVIARAIGSLGLMLACLLPLLLAAYVVRGMNQNTGDDSALVELLVLEIEADRPLLLSESPRPVASLGHAEPSGDVIQESSAATAE